MTLNRRHFLGAGALAVPVLAGGSAVAEPGRAPRPSEQGSHRRGPAGRAGLAGPCKGRKLGVLSNPTGVLPNG